MLSNGFSESSKTTGFYSPYPQDEKDYADNYDYEDDSDLDVESEADLNEEAEHEDNSIQSLGCQSENSVFDRHPQISADDEFNRLDGSPSPANAAGEPRSTSMDFDITLSDAGKFLVPLRYRFREGFASP